jgi:hypothetical protein
MYSQDRRERSLFRLPGTMGCAMKSGKFLCIAIIVVESLHAQPPSVNINPITQRVEKDSVAVVRISVNSLPICHAYDVQVTYGPLIVRCRSVRTLHFIRGQTFFSALNDSTNGKLTVDEALLGQGGQSGTGDLVELRFVGLLGGNAALSFSNADFRDPANQAIAVTSNGGNIQVGLPTAVRKGQQPVWKGIVMKGCHPNPFNPSTTIRYTRSDAGRATVRIYTLLGREVFSQSEEHQDQGEQTFVWHGRDREGRGVASGVYFVRVETVSSAAMTRVLLVR